MSQSDTETLKQQLLTSDEHFAALAAEHAGYEERLAELRALPYPTDEEQLEETTLKKKKLALKDEMEVILLRHRAAAG